MIQDESISEVVFSAYLSLNSLVSLYNSSEYKLSSVNPIKVKKNTAEARSYNPKEIDNEIPFDSQKASEIIRFLFITVHT